MTSLSPCIHAVRQRLRSALVLVLLASLAAVVTAAVGAGQATAASNAVHSGRGYRLSTGDFVGYYLTAGGQKIYCLSPHEGVPRTVSLHTVSRYGRLDAATGAALAYALRTWGDAHSVGAAATESQVLNTLVGNGADVARRAKSIPHSLRATVAAHVAQAEADRGPYSVRLHLSAAVTPGRSAVGEVRVRTGGGHWLTGTRITLSHSTNAAMPRTVHTDRHGVARFTYSVTDVGEVSVGATTTGLASIHFRMSSPRSGEQRMVSWQPRATAHAITHFRAVPASFSHSYDCSTTCNGHPATQLSACAAASRYASRIVYRVGSTSVTVGFAASSARRCITRTVTAADGNRVGATWQYRTAHGWSHAVPAAGTFVVDCPAPPAIGTTMTYDCTRTSVTIGLAHLATDGTWTPAVNTSKHLEVLVIGGARTAQVSAAHGRAAVYRTTLACGDKQTITARAGVQRTNGDWNYGPISAITTP